MDRSFAPFAEDFPAITGEGVWCTATSVDAAGRPRSRILHPIFEVVEGRPFGWVATARTPIKTTQLAASPHVAVAYWGPAQHTVVARWVDDEAGKRDVWDLFAATPPPLGYPLADPGMEDPTSPLFTPLRLDPWRVQVYRFRGWEHGVAPRTWRAAG